MLRSRPYQVERGIGPGPKQLGESLEQEGVPLLWVKARNAHELEGAATERGPRAFDVVLAQGEPLRSLAVWDE